MHMILLYHMSGLSVSDVARFVCFSFEPSVEDTRQKTRKQERKREDHYLILSDASSQ